MGYEYELGHVRNQKFNKPNMDFTELRCKSVINRAKNAAGTILIYNNSSFTT